MTAEQKFHGVDLGWMQAQWRDCADKGKQMQIFRDMTGRKATVQEILDAVGDPAYCGPMCAAKRGYRRYTPEDDAEILRMVAEGLSNSQIGDAFGVDASSINFRLTKLRKRGVEIPARKHAFGRKAKPAEEPEEKSVPVPDKAQSAHEEWLPGYVSGGLRQAEAELTALMKEGKDLEARLEEVKAQIGAFRKSLSDLLAMAGGGLTNGNG